MESRREAKLKMAKESQYIDRYLEVAAAHRYTPGTFLAYTLAGKAKRYGAGYTRALLRAINRRLSTGEVVAVRSAHGATAYVRKEVVE